MEARFNTFDKHLKVLTFITVLWNVYALAVNAL